MVDWSGDVTICVKCKHHKRMGRRDIDVWYTHYCGHPELQRAKVTDPVTGRLGYGIKNDLGRCMVGVDRGDRYPNCRDINPRGECELYEGTEDVK